MRADNIPARTSEWATAEYRAVIATLASARLEPLRTLGDCDPGIHRWLTEVTTHGSSITAPVDPAPQGRQLIAAMRDNLKGGDTHGSSYPAPADPAP
jgi:hypothetical protein